MINKTTNCLNYCKSHLSEIIHDKNHKVNRVARSIFPFINFYSPLRAVTSPLSQLLLITDHVQSSYVNLSGALRNYRDKQIGVDTYHRLAKGILEVAIIISAIAYFPLSMALATVHELTNEAAAMVDLFREGTQTKGQIALGLYRCTVLTFRLAAFVIAGPEMIIASVALQIFLEIGQSYSEFRKGRYIEAISNLALALLRSYFLIPHIQEVVHKWSKKEKALPVPFPLQLEEGIERRAAIDVGSGGTKVLIADVDTRTNQIVQVVFEHSFSVPYQASLEKSPQQAFDQKICEMGLKTFQEIKTVLDQHGVQKVSAIATEAFRKAANGTAFAHEVEKQTQIPLRIISQEQEGIIAFNSALGVSNTNPKQTIVWDIGTGSFQITNLNDADQFEIFTGGVGSVPFKNHIIDKIQGKDPALVPTPNPISAEEYRSIGRYARKLARQATSDLKHKINSSDITIVGIGRLFFKSVLPLVSEGNTIDRKGLRAFIRSTHDKNDLELNNSFASMDVPNAMQVLEVMKALHIHKIHVIDTTTVAGIVRGSNQDFTDWNTSS